MSKKGGEGGNLQSKKIHCKFTQVDAYLQIFVKNAMKFPKIRRVGVSKAVWIFSRNSSNLADTGFPKQGLHSAHPMDNGYPFAYMLSCLCPHPFLTFLVNLPLHYASCLTLPYQVTKQALTFNSPFDILIIFSILIYFIFTTSYKRAIICPCSSNI